MTTPVRSSYIRRKDMDSVLNCLISDRLSAGTFLEAFVRQAKDKLAFDSGVAFRSKIDALVQGLSCFGLEPGDAVAISALAPAWAHYAILQAGFVPLWMDSSIDNINFGDDAKDRIAKENGKAVFIASPMGMMPEPQDVEALELPIIEDISSTVTGSIITSDGEKKAGFLGNYAILGLEDGDMITAGGGALLFASQRRDGIVLRNRSESLPQEEKLSDMNAALAHAQLKDIEKLVQKRQEIFSLYEQSLGRSHKHCLGFSGEGNNPRYACVVILDSGIKDVRAYAKKKDVETIMAFENSCIANGLVPEGLCPKAASILNRAVAFPLHPRIGKTVAQKISRVLATLP